MRLPRRKFLHLAASAAALPAASRFAWAQAYPTRPVRLIVGFAAGGTTDITARLVGQWLSDRLGQQFLIENRTGAATNIATEAVVRAPADGYTLLVVTASNAINATLYDKLNFNFMRDIAPVAGIIRYPLVMQVNPSFPGKTVPEFIDYAKANAGKISYGSGGIGTSIHVASELFKMMTGVDMTHVPYRGGAPAMTDLMAGQVQVVFNPVPESMEFIRGGKLRPLAVTSTTRSHVLPEVPTVAEVRARLRGPRGAGDRRAQGHAGRDRQSAQQGNQRRPRRSQAEGAVRRPRRRGVRGLARRVRSVHGRRNGEVGQGDQLRRHQDTITRPANSITAFSECVPMATVGHERRVAPVCNISALRPTSAQKRTFNHFAFGPIPDSMHRSKRRAWLNILFDHVVGAQQDRRGYGEPEGSGGFEIDE